MQVVTSPVREGKHALRAEVRQGDDPINASGDAAYAITSPTWIIAYKKQPDANTASALKGWLRFLLTDGQGFASSVGFAKLPADLATKAITQLDQITGT